MIRAQAILHCHPVRFDYSYVAFQLIKAVSQADDCKDLCLLPHPCFPLGCRSNPPCMPSFLPGILFGLHPLPDEQSCGISSSQFFLPVRAGLPLFEQAAGSCPSTASLCPVYSGCRFRLPPGPPVRTSISAPAHALTRPRGLPHPTAQPLGVPHLGAARPAQMTNSTIHLGHHSPLS